jgi:glycosyltransferase involved in cell wall biosynthesis
VNESKSIAFSLILPTLNEEWRLPLLLDSIRRQRYPRESIELLVADGGSTDRTVAIAREFGATVSHNPIGRAEPGAGMLLQRASGDVGVLLAADNVFNDEYFLEKLARPFADTNVAAAVPALINTRRDGATTRYFNAFSDPFNHFVYGGATSPASYHRTFRVKRATPDYIVYDFGAGPTPLIALAQAFAIRLPYAKPAGTDEDDVAPVETLIAQGREIAFVPDARLEHHTVGGIGDALRKFGPRFRARMTDSAQPMWGRLRTTGRAQRVRAYLWPFYSVSFVFPMASSVYGLVADRRSEWLYHPFVSAAFGFEFWKQAAMLAFARLNGGRPRTAD